MGQPAFGSLVRYVHHHSGSRRALAALAEAEQNATSYGASTALAPGRRSAHDSTEVMALEGKLIHVRSSVHS